MSTRDNLPSNPDGKAPANGVNAYKIKSGGLAAPVVPTEKPRDTPRPERPAPKPRPTRLSGALLALAMALGVVWFFLRDGRMPDTWRDAGPGVSAGSGGVANAASVLPDYRALVIGINQYAPADGKGWHVLNSARADAESVARILAGEYGFQVRTLLDGEASRAAILQALDELATTGADGADLIYFAGHGAFDEKLNEGYWIPADARRQIDGRDAKEDWLWNSTITRLIGASQARHVLVMSDACYSGALFRGDEPLRAHGGQAWYERAIAKPSRFLITSGGIEPVLDSSGGHSVFAQQVIHYLQHGEKAIFSANDLGSALRERVAALTGQMVQMGPLPLGSHFGGEFVFIRKPSGIRLAAAAPDELPGPGGLRGPGEETDAQWRQETLRSAAELLQAGAPQAAGNLVAGVLRENAQDEMARAVAAAIGRTQRREAHDDLRKLIEQVEAKGRQERPETPVTRPRVLACLGPDLPEGGTPAAEGAARLYRIVLRAELEAQAGIKVIEREALATLLQEQRLGFSGLADPRARLAIGKLLPASVLLLGDLMISTAGVETLYLRLVDTETTQVLASFTASRRPEEALNELCSGLAARIVERIAALKPMLAPVTVIEGHRLRAAFGTFHGARSNQVFTVLARAPALGTTPDDWQEQAVGTARVTRAEAFTCELEAAWGADDRPAPQNLWLREIAADP
jgi:hypothetical protein